jgi:hypothetical protein
MRNCVGLATAAWLLLVPVSGRACSVPVFRYAIERWLPGPYEVLVFHQGPLGEGPRQALNEIKALAEGANLDVVTVDVNGRLDEEYKSVWEKYGKEKPLPWVIVRSPETDVKAPPAWSAALDSARFKALVDSDFRQRIARKLVTGDSAVFVLLESGDDKADAAANKLLATELARLEKSIVLPAPTKQGPQLRSPLPLQVSFAHLRLSRRNADEREFIDALLRCEKGLDKERGPVVFVVTGRGRLLTALHGKDLKAAELEAVASFVCGACSCQVKELNPGIDLIFKARWDTIFDIELAPQPRELKLPSSATEKR